MHRLLDYLEVIVARRKFLVLNILVVCVVAAVVSFVLPSRYRAEATILPPAESDIPSLTGGGAVGLVGLARLTGGLLSGTSSTDLVIGILRSNNVMRRVVERCGVIQNMRIRSGSMEDAVKALGKATRIGLTDEGVVTVAFEARSPTWAAEVANTYVEELDQFLRSSNVSSGRNMRRFIEKRLNEVDASLATAQESLRVFQESNKVFTIDEGVKAAFDFYASLRSRYALVEVRLRSLQAVAGTDSPLTSGLAREARALREQLRLIESGGDGEGFGPGFAVSLSDLPAVAGEYLLRYRDVRVQEEAYAVLYTQYEYARILEARDSPTLTIVDVAIPPEKRSFPRRWVIVVAALLFSLAYGVAAVFLVEHFRRLRDRDAVAFDRWVAVANALRSSLNLRKGPPKRGHPGN